jgi:uncharacterized protein YqkB
MFIELSESARHELGKRNPSASDRIYLLYDTEGCGCAVSGVAAIMVADESFDESGERAESNADLPLYYLPRQAIFFEDRLRLDYRADHRAFVLKSDSQTYGSHLPVSDRRGAARAPSSVSQ